MAMTNLMMDAAGMAAERAHEMAELRRAARHAVLQWVLAATKSMLGVGGGASEHPRGLAASDQGTSQTREPTFCGARTAAI